MKQYFIFILYILIHLGRPSFVDLQTSDLKTGEENEITINFFLPDKQMAWVAVYFPENVKYKEFIETDAINQVVTFEQSLQRLKVAGDFGNSGGSNIKFTIYNQPDDFGETIMRIRFFEINEESSEFTKSFQVTHDSIKECKLIPSTPTTNSRTNFILSFLPKFAVPKGSHIKLTIPIINPTAPESEQVRMVNQESICSNQQNTESTIYCDLNGNNLIIKDGFLLQDSSVDKVEIIIENMFTSYNIGAISGLNIEVFNPTNNGVVYTDYNILTYISDQIFLSFIEFSSTDQVIRKDTILNYKVRIQDMFIEAGTKFVIILPQNVYTETPGDIEVYGIQYFSQNKLTHTIDGNKLVLDNVFPEYINDEQPIYIEIKVLNIQNAPNAKDDTTFPGIQLLNSEDKFVAIVQADPYIVKTLPLLNASINFSQQTINKVTIATVDFKLVSSLTIQSHIEVNFPSQIYLENTQNSQCQANQLILGLSSTAQCQAQGGKYIIKNLFLEPALEGHRIKFTIPQIRTPLTTKQTDNIQIVTLQEGFPVDQTLAGFNFQAQPGKLYINYFTSSTDKTNEIANLQLSVRTENPVTAQTNMIVTLPDQFNMNLEVNPNMQCELKSGFGQQASCRFDGNSIIVSNIVELTTQTMTFRIDVNQIFNPRSLEPTGNIQVRTQISNQEVIDLQENDKSLVLSSVNEIEIIGITPQDNRLSITTDYIFELKVNSRIENLDSLEIQLPPQITLLQDQEISCSGITVLDQQITCKKNPTNIQVFKITFNSSLQHGYFLKFKVKNIRNSVKQEPATPFGFKLSTGLGFTMSQSKDLVGIQQFQPLQSKSLEIQTNSNYVAEVVSYVFEFTNKIEIPPSGYILITLPNFLSIQTNTHTELLGIPNGAVFERLSSNIMRINLLEEPIPQETEISFNFLEIQNSLDNSLDFDDGEEEFIIETQTAQQVSIELNSIFSQFQYVCSHGCITCKNDKMHCLSCDIGYNIEANKCIKQCTSGHYLVDNSTCKPCQSHCSQCDSNNCIVCNEGYKLYEKECIVPSQVKPGTVKVEVVKNTDKMEAKDYPTALRITYVVLILFIFIITKKICMSYKTLKVTTALIALLSNIEVLLSLASLVQFSLEKHALKWILAQAGLILIYIGIQVLQSWKYKTLTDKYPDLLIISSGSRGTCINNILIRFWNFRSFLLFVSEWTRGKNYRIETIHKSLILINIRKLIVFNFLWNLGQLALPLVFVMEKIKQNDVQYNLYFLEFTVFEALMILLLLIQVCYLTSLIKEDQKTSISEKLQATELKNETIHQKTFQKALTMNSQINLKSKYPSTFKTSSHRNSSKIIGQHNYQDESQTINNDDIEIQAKSENSAPKSVRFDKQFNGQLATFQAHQSSNSNSLKKSNLKKPHKIQTSSFYIEDEGNSSIQGKHINNNIESFGYNEGQHYDEVELNERQIGQEMRRQGSQDQNESISSEISNGMQKNNLIRKPSEEEDHIFTSENNMISQIQHQGMFENNLDTVDEQDIECSPEKGYKSSAKNRSSFGDNKIYRSQKNKSAQDQIQNQSANVKIKHLSKEIFMSENFKRTQKKDQLISGECSKIPDFEY